MKKTPTTEAPTEPKEDPVEELVPAQVLNPSEDRTGTLDCSLAPSLILMVYGCHW